MYSDTATDTIVEVDETSGLTVDGTHLSTWGYGLKVTSPKIASQIARTAFTA